MRQSGFATLPSLKPPAHGARLVATVTALVCIAFAWPAISLLHATSSMQWSSGIKWKCGAIIALAALELVRTVSRTDFSLPLSIFWAWNFVFMGLAPAYQLSLYKFPWSGSFTAGSIGSAQTLLLLGNICVVFAAEYTRHVRRGQSHEANAGPTPDINAASASRLISSMAYAYSLAAALFIVLMGSSLYQARATFRSQVLRIAELPLGGTLYFVVTAGAITVPAVAIAARRAGAPVPIAPIATSVLTAAIATNPFLGSRFLTGSFLVAVGAAVIGRRPILRALPIGSVLLLVLLFPSLDTLRGDGTGSQRVELVPAAESLVTYNFDAFEMLVREQSLTVTTREQMPSSVDLALAPVLRWVPLLSRPYIGLAGGDAVAKATGMQYTNVSMPLWGEGDLIAGPLGSCLLLASLGLWLGLATTPLTRWANQSSDLASTSIAPASAALLFIVLRGSLYEVFTYLALVMIVYLLIQRSIKLPATPIKERDPS
jgi:hypothetical protein